MKQYLKDISSYGLLSAKEEKDLAYKAVAGDQSARDALITGNLRFVIKLAKSYENQGVSLDDLIQEGNLGLMIAVDKFEPDKGFRLTTYASWWIRQAFLRALMDDSKVIRIPSSRLASINKIRKMTDTLAHKLGRLPYVGEVEDNLEGVDVNKILTDIDKPIELNSFNKDDQEYLDFVEQTSEEPPDGNEIEDLRKEVSFITKDLAEREKEVMELYFGLGGNKKLKLEEIGNLFHLSRERIRQIKDRALQQIKEHPDIEKLRAYL